MVNKTTIRELEQRIEAMVERRENLGGFNADAADILEIAQAVLTILQYLKKQ